MPSQEWLRRVSTVFSVYPRIGVSKKTLWLERKNATRRFAETFERPGAHVCFDGPTGAGKTSLALTHLVSSQVPHVAIQLTHSMEWPAFCRQVMTPPPSREDSVSSELEIGLDKGLPVAKFRVALGEKAKPLDDVDLLQRLSATWTEHDVARQLANQNAALFVDDVERATDDLLSRLADLCKLLTQTFVSANAKLILVGSGDIYQRIYRENPALEDRLLQVSLGGFRYQNDSVALISRGLNLLGLRHPWNSEFTEQREKTHLCRTKIWEAADGLPKNLNRLGQEIALNAENRKGVGWSHMVEVAERMTEDHWVEYAQRFPNVVDYLYDHPPAIEIVKALFHDGIARIHKLPALVQKVRETFSASSAQDIEREVDQLCAADFLVRTGKSGELVFVKHPTAAHTLGVAMRDPNRFRQIIDLQRGMPPLEAAFPIALGGTEAEEYGDDLSPDA